MSKYKTTPQHDKSSALLLAVPRTATGLMQLLQTLVGREHHYVWCGGYIAPHKLQAFVQRMGERYPLARNARQRSYDRKRGRAVVHLVVFPRERDVQWWLLSNAGGGGLADPTSPDAHVAKDARSSTQHIEFEEYVLLYANKKVPSKGQEKHRETSTWTWKLRSEVVTTIRASIEQECRSLKFGSEGTNGWGLRGLLDRQRRRPLFSGVRNQVIELHRYAHELWGRRRMEWQSRHPDLTGRYGAAAGALTPMKLVMSEQLPLLPRLKIYDDRPRRVLDLCTAVSGTPSEGRADVDS